MAEDGNKVPLTICEVGYKRDQVIQKEIVIRTKLQLFLGKGWILFDEDCDTFFLIYDAGTNSDQSVIDFENVVKGPPPIEIKRKVFSVTIEGTLGDNRFPLEGGVIPPFGVFYPKKIMSYFRILDAPVK